MIRWKWIPGDTLNRKHLVVDMDDKNVFLVGINYRHFTIEGHGFEEPKNLIQYIRDKVYGGILRELAGVTEGEDAEDEVDEWSP